MVQIYITLDAGSALLSQGQPWHRQTHLHVGESTLMFKKYNVELQAVWGMSDTKVFKGCPSHLIPVCIS